MAFFNITATIGIDRLDNVESSLRKAGVPGVSITKVRGYGQYKNFFQRDFLTTHARIQIYAPDDRIDAIVEAIMGAAHTGAESDGVIVVSPIAKMYRIDDRREAKPEDF